MRCEICKQKMDEDCGCVKHAYVHNGKEVEAIRFQSRNGRERCGDCATSNGEYHHYGCDMERCPVCGGQLISCSCFGDQIEIVTEQPAPLPVDSKRAKQKS